MMKKGFAVAAAVFGFACVSLNAQEPVFLEHCLRPLPNDTAMCYVVKTNQIYEEGLDTMPQIIFWRRVMTMSPDSGILSLYGKRTIYGTYAVAEWDKLGEEKQMAFRDSIK